MLSTTHTLVGAAIGKSTGNPALSFFLGVISHFILDKVPHFWPWKKTKRLEEGLLDWFFVGLIIIYILLSPMQYKTAVISGAFGGLIVDIVLVGIPQVRKSKVGKWHNHRQPHHRKGLQYFMADLSLIIFCLIYLVAAR